MIAPLAEVPDRPPVARRLPVESIVESIGSVELLEVLLLLSRSADTFWTASAVAQHLGIAESVVAKALEVLVAEKLIVPARDTVAYRYAPKDDSSANLERLRAFAESFKLKKE